MGLLLVLPVNHAARRRTLWAAPSAGEVGGIPPGALGRVRLGAHGFAACYTGHIRSCVLLTRGNRVVLGVMAQVRAPCAVQ